MSDNENDWYRNQEKLQEKIRNRYHQQGEKSKRIPSKKLRKVARKTTK